MNPRWNEEAARRDDVTGQKQTDAESETYIWMSTDYAEYLGMHKPDV